MYKVAIPVTNWYPNREMDEEGTLRELRRAGAERVWLCTARGIEGEDVLTAQLRALKRHRAFFESHVVEVGVWLSSLGHGGALSHEDGQDLEKAERYVRQVSLGGGTSEDSFCPMCEPFAGDYSAWIGRIAETGARMIMIDDDYRLSLHGPGGPGCCCEKHMREYSRRVGRDMRREELEGLVFSGGPNRYRDAWLDMGRDALLGLARRIRAEVDRVDPTVRVGVCAVMSTWDSDGLSALELTKTLAGGTKPFLRTIGAPYWAALRQLAQRLGHIIEIARIQRHWAEGSGVELFTEGDAYPRPRYNTPAAYLEAYDMALRADGGFDGILKYMLDYTSSLRYETGYIDMMARNRPAYEWIEAHLSGGEAAGVDVVCPYARLRDAELPAGTTGSWAQERAFYPAASRLRTDSSLPAASGPRAVHAVCGESARHMDLSLLYDGAVLDAAAARILIERGVDVGIERMSDYEPMGGVEYFPDEDEHVACGVCARARRLTLKPGAEMLSTIHGAVSCFRYENAAGQRFVVYAFDMNEAVWTQSLTRGYSRQRQLIDGLEWAGRKALPAVLPGCPDAYLICKCTSEGLGVGIWNLSPDALLSPRLITEGGFGGAACFGCEVEREDDRTWRVRGEIAPYAFAGILLQQA